MLKRIILIISLFISCIFINVGAQTLTAKEIIKKADEKSRGLTSQGEMTMTIVRPAWTRSVTMKSWQKGTEYSMILITSPAKDKGQMFLKIKTDMWNWVPSIEKMIKIPPSMMMQSWMGSDYTNDDLVRESSIVNDYTHKLLGNELIREQMCYKIELIPLAEAAVTWGKVILWITTDGFNQWKAEYYDEDMKLVNILNASNIKKMGDREIPTKMEISPQDKKGNKTVLEIKSIVFNQIINDTFFSQQNMKKLSQTTK
ncbi:MAG: outer membrane lipoprotein-sorting protein [Bacteroidetes bacterium]|nr:outer membrane lipoprotein-sorting protein [Bacteroidota bacterium]